MPRSNRPSFSDLTGESILAAAFERLRPRLLAMVGRRVGSKMALRIDPEGLVQDAFLRARDRWLAPGPRPADLDAFVYGQVHDRLVELVRGALGPVRDLERDQSLPEGSSDALVERLVDSHTGPATCLSRDERRAVVRAALERIDPIDREILALRYFDDLSFAQIGAILGLPPNRANKRALRAMVRLSGLIPDAMRPPEA